MRSRDVRVGADPCRSRLLQRCYLR